MSVHQQYNLVFRAYSDNYMACRYSGDIAPHFEGILCKLISTDEVAEILLEDIAAITNGTWSGEEGWDNTMGREAGPETIRLGLNDGTAYLYYIDEPEVTYNMPISDLKAILEEWLAFKNGIVPPPPPVYTRNYEEAIGYYNRESVTNKRYEDYFIEDIDPAIKPIVDNFIAALNTLPSNINFISSATTLINNWATQLWQQAVTSVQTNNNENPDDRPLYWARIKMQVALKSHSYFNGGTVNQAELNQLIKLFEEKSRNYTGVDFSTAPVGVKKILITGFDPFQLNPLYGPDAIKTQNPSGIAALNLQGKTITDAQGNKGYVQMAIFPVRYKDFDNGVIEDLVTPFLSTNSLDMIMSLNLNGGAFFFDLERYAAKNRGGFHDNLNIGTSPASFPDIDSSSFNQNIGSGNDYYETTLPNDKIVDALVANGFNTVGQRIFFDQSYFGSNASSLNEHPIINAIDSNIVNTNTKYQMSITDIQRGSGGDYLSNEIFYRIARTREENNSNVKTGHYHLANTQGGIPSSILNRHPSISNVITSSTYSNFTIQEVLNEVSNAIKRSLNAL